MLASSRPARLAAFVVGEAASWAAFGLGEERAEALGPAVSEVAEEAAEVAAEAAAARSPMAEAVLRSINADRRRRGHEPLVFDTRLVAACQVTADRVSDGGADAVDIADVLSGEVEARGYSVGTLQMGFGKMFGDPTAAVAAWRAGAPSTFESLAARELKDFGFGVGSDAGVPSYVLAAGVSMGDVLADAAADLDDVRGVRRSVLDDVNEARRREGLAEMWGSPDLDRVAQSYADDMWRRGYYGHDSPEGENVRDRVRRARLLVQRVGENVASGQPRADEVMRGWLNSPPHRANILHEDFNALGTGVAAGYRDDGRYEIRWVQVFAQIPR